MDRIRVSRVFGVKRKSKRGRGRAPCHIRPEAEKDFVKQPLVGAVIIGSLFCSCLGAQRGGMAWGGGARYQGNHVLLLGDPLQPWRFINPGLPVHHVRGWGFDRRGFNGYGYPFGGYPLGVSYGDAPEYADGAPQPGGTIIVLVPQFEAPVLPPPPPIRPQIHEYNWPAPGGDAMPARFSIVSKDHNVESAVAVWVQDGVVHYVTPDGRDHQMKVQSVDREATRQRNAQKGLSLWLPAGS